MSAAAPAPDEPGGFLASLRNYHPDTGLLISSIVMLAVLITVFSFTSERFFSQAVVVNILNQTSIYIIAGVGMTLVLTSGGIDISIGSIIGLTATIMGLLMIDQGMPAVVAIVVALLVGALCGAFNGFLVAVVKVPPIIVTLGTLTFFRGLAYLLGEGRVFMRFPDPLPWLGDGRVLGLPVPVYIATLTVIGGHFFLTSTRMGQRITAVGGNEEAARLAGINVVRTKFFTYVIMGVLTGLTTVVIVARQDAAQAVFGFGIELHVIAAVILGGTSLFGGRGLILGTVLGALILGVLNTGLLLSGVVQFWQLVALGILLIAVVAFRMAREGTELK
jgi:ribose/xylose/arabinose/galactoside ABC-type transport system permease subunit